MSENFTKQNPELERRIAQCESALDIRALLSDVPVTDVLRGSAPAIAMPERPVGTRLKKMVQTDDGREILIQADSFFGLDILEEGGRRGQIR
jgi:hypothetical protein